MSSEDKDSSPPPPPPPGSDAAEQVLVSVLEQSQSTVEKVDLNFSITKKEAEERAVQNRVQFRIHDGKEYFIDNWTGRLIERAFVEPLRSNSKRGARNAFLDIGCLVAFCKRRAQIKGNAGYNELLRRIANFYGLSKDELPLPVAPDPKLLDNGMSISEYQKLYMPYSLLDPARIEKLSLTPEEFRAKHGNKRAVRKRAAPATDASASASAGAGEPPQKKQDRKRFHVYRQMPGQAERLQLTPERGGTVKDLERALCEELPGAVEYASRPLVTGGLMFWQLIPSPRAGRNVRAERQLYKKRETASRPVVGPAILAVDLPTDPTEGEAEVGRETRQDQQS